MATELLALSPTDEPDLPLLLIEEPEAHLHPQLQTRLIRFIRGRSKISQSCNREKMQVIATSHSPHFAAQVPLDHVTILNGGGAYSLHPSQTLLDPSDYEFLSRFLDVTKANLFFACGLIVVEGDAEVLLLPMLAAQIGRPLDRFAVSIVNVGHVGLFRYSRIFQRRSGTPLPVNVACIADRDIPPVEAKPLLPAKRKTEGEVSDQYIANRIDSRTRNDAQQVKTFVSPKWTLEYDLALSGIRSYLLAAVCLARYAKSQGYFPKGKSYYRCLRLAILLERRWVKRGDSPETIAVLIYRPLLLKEASKAETAQALARLLSQKPSRNLEALLPRYLVDAIKYVTGG